MKKIIFLFLTIKFFEKSIKDWYKYQKKYDILLPFTTILFIWISKNLPLIKYIIWK